MNKADHENDDEIKTTHPVTGDVVEELNLAMAIALTGVISGGVISH